MSARTDIEKKKEIEHRLEAVRGCFVRLLNSEDGSQAIEHLESLLDSQSYLPGRSAEEVAFYEGQRYAYREIILLSKPVER